MTVTLLLTSSTQSKHGLPLYSTHTCATSAMNEYERGGRDALARYLAQAGSSCNSGVISIRKDDSITDLVGLKLSPEETEFGKQIRENTNVTVKALPLHTVSPIFRRA